MKNWKIILLLALMIFNVVYVGIVIHSAKAVISMIGICVVVPLIFSKMPQIEN